MSNALPNTTAAPPVPYIAPNLTRRQEAYARTVATGMSYAEAFRQAGLVASTVGSMSRQISQLNKTPKVAARIMELRSKNDAAIEMTYAEKTSWLRLVIQADPAELERLVIDPCDLCWTDKALADAMAAYYSPVTPFDAEGLRADPPDCLKPRSDCPHCRGNGVERYIHTPTDELSPAGRALYKGLAVDAQGRIRVVMRDQDAALDMLNRMHSSYVTRSLNLNANVAVHAARDASPEDALKLFDAFGGGP